MPSCQSAPIPKHAPKQKSFMFPLKQHSLSQMPRFNHNHSLSNKKNRLLLIIHTNFRKLNTFITTTKSGVLFFHLFFLYQSYLSSTYPTQSLNPPATTTPTRHTHTKEPPPTTFTLKSATIIKNHYILITHPTTHSADGPW